MGSERGFGIVFGVVFALLALLPVLSGAMPVPFLAGLSGIMFLLAWRAPAILRVPNRLWFQLGMLLGRIVAPVVMALVFYLVFLPIGLIMRLCGRDPLHRRRDPTRSSYWIPREAPMQSMKRQF
jgi:hypothetical protein